MIRSSKHSLKFSNHSKLSILNDFIIEYRRVGELILDKLWYQGIGEFQPCSDNLQKCPKYIDYRKYNIKTDLSARVLRTLTTQLCSVVRSSIKKRKNVLYLIEQGKISSKQAKKLLKKYPLRKPKLNNLKPELNSICCDFKDGSNYFDEFVQLKSLGKKYGKIKLPIKHTKVYNRWNKKGEKLNSILLDKNSICFRFQISKLNIRNKQQGVLGVDQGLNTLASLSDQQTTPEKDQHGHSFDSILCTISRKKGGSKAFKRAQEHRKNFINWSINQLNFQDYTEIRLEKVWNIGYKKKRSRKLSHWTNTLIRDKIKSRAEEQEVPVIEQDPSYRSQRCFNCGLVRKANRKGKIYKCKNCKYEVDADYNASLNHTIDLPYIDWSFRNQRNNLKNGFFWRTNGLFSFDGEEFTVPLSKNKKV